MKALLRRLVHLWFSWVRFYANEKITRERVGKHATLFQGIVLDVGAGNKPYRALFNKVDKYLGANSSEYYRTTMPEDVRANTDVWLDDSLPLPFDNCAFDGLVCLSVLPQIDKPDEFFRELARLLKPGGHLLLTTEFLYPKWAANDCLRHTDVGLRSLAQANGFDVVTVESIGGVWTTIHCLLMRNVSDYPGRILNTPSLFWKAWSCVLYLWWIVTMPVSS